MLLYKPYNALYLRLRSQITKWLKLILPLLLGFFLLWWIYGKFSPEQLHKIKFHFKNANYGYIALSAIFGFLSHLSRAYRWNYLLRPLGYTPKLYNMIMAVGISYIMNIFVPRSGEVSRALVVKKYEQIPFDKAFGTIVAERIVDTLILIAFTALAFSLQYNILSDFLGSNVDPYQLILFLGIAGVVFLLLLGYIRRSNTGFSKKIKVFIKGFKTGILSILHMKKMGFFIAHTLFIWMMYLAMFYATVFALEETRVIPFTAVISSFVVGGFVIAFTNGGFAYYPIFIAQILTLYDVPYETGTAFGWIAWTSQFVMILLFGGISLMLLPVFNRKNRSVWQK